MRKIIKFIKDFNFSMKWDNPDSKGELKINIFGLALFIVVVKLFINFLTAKP